MQRKHFSILLLTVITFSGCNMDEGKQSQDNYSQESNNISDSLIDSTTKNNPLINTSTSDISESLSEGKPIADSNHIIIKNRINVPEDYKSLDEAISNAKSGSTIILNSGTYQISNVDIEKENITIASKFILNNDRSKIDDTIIKGIKTKPIFTGKRSSSNNLKFIGLTFTNARKAITFNEYGIVQYCKFNNMHHDVISFEGHAIGGEVTNSLVEGSGDEAIDIDSRKGGEFLIANNEFYNVDDDGIEIRLYNYTGEKVMHYDIHHNIISGSGEDGIQLIDYDKKSNRSFDIHHNIIKDSKDVGIGSTVNGNTKENALGSEMEENVNIYNNYFLKNSSHITGGNNMSIKKNYFKSASDNAIYNANKNSNITHNYFDDNLQDLVASSAVSKNTFDKEFTLKDFKKKSEHIGIINIINQKPSPINRFSLTLDQDKFLTKPNNSLELNAKSSESQSSYLWSLKDGPAEVNFENKRSLNTKVTFTKQGKYTLQLSANNGQTKQSNTMNVYYLFDHKENTIKLKNRKSRISANDYSFLYASTASKNSEITAQDDQTMADYIIDTNGKDLAFKIKVLMKSSNNDVKTLRVTLFGSEGVVSALIHVSSTQYQWVKVNKKFKTTAGIWRIRLEAQDEGLSWKSLELKK